MKLFYAIDNAQHVRINDGLEGEHQARRVAQEMANARGETCYYYPQDEEDEFEFGTSVEPMPSSLR